MFKYSWNNGVRDMYVIYFNNWKRLNSCKAATYSHSQWTTDYDHNREVKIQTFYLASYATPILKVRRSYYMDNAEIIHTNIDINEDSWNCSNTTIRHIARFCRNLDFFYGIDISYHDIKHAMEESSLRYESKDKWRGLCVTIKEHMTVRPKTSEQIEDMFRCECPMFAVRCD